MIWEFTAYKGTSTIPELKYVQAYSIEEAIQILRWEDYTVEPVTIIKLLPPHMR